MTNAQDIKKIAGIAKRQNLKIRMLRTNQIIEPKDLHKYKDKLCSQPLNENWTYCR